MSRSQRDIAYRLELTREALGVSAAELCKNVGMGTNQWSQYVDPEGDRRITVDAIYRLKDEYGITFEWIYDGDRSRLPSDLLEKIRATERLGTVDLSRARGRRSKIKPPPPDSRPVK
jgi:transcriptional regulator with XRE-family HTH domain